jgi:hypothetical protein
MKRVIAMVVLGIGGLAAAIALTVGALALAGDVGSVVETNITPSTLTSHTTPSPSRDDDDRSDTPSPSVDDHGGDDGSDDNSGSNSGSGSSNSGSGSSNSGSGSGDD